MLSVIGSCFTFRLVATCTYWLRLLGFLLHPQLDGFLHPCTFWHLHTCIPQSCHRNSFTFFVNVILENAQPPPLFGFVYESDQECGTSFIHNIYYLGYCFIGNIPSIRLWSTKLTCYLKKTIILWTLYVSFLSCCKLLGRACLRISDPRNR